MHFNLLKKTFAGFVCTRGMSRYCRRFAIVDIFREVAPSKDAPPWLTQTPIITKKTNPANVLSKPSRLSRPKHVHVSRHSQVRL